MRGSASGGRLFLLAAALVVLLVPGSATAATVVNGDFESGTLNGWHVHRVTDSDNWFAYKGTDAPIKKQIIHPVQPPPQGLYAATTDEIIPDTLILYQDVALEAGSSQWLSLLAYYDSYKPIAIPTPDTLSVDEEVIGGQSNQQYRIDVMKPDAPIDSVDPADILRTVLQTKPGDPVSLPPTKFTVDLSPFAGQTVRLRIANAVHEEVFNAGVDAVSISNTPPGQSSPGGSKSHASNRFSVGKAKANRRNGTVALPVQVPGAGLLTAKGKSTSPSAHTAEASKSKKLGKLVKPVTVRVGSARTVTIRLKPTSAAQRILRQKHKLRVKVEVAFTPGGGSRETTTVPVMLELRPR